MNALVILIPTALLLGGLALGAFLWSLKSDQYEDLDGAGWRIISDDEIPGAPPADPEPRA